MASERQREVEAMELMWERDWERKTQETVALDRQIEQSAVSQKERALRPLYPQFSRAALEADDDLRELVRRVVTDLRKLRNLPDTFYKRRC